MPTTPIYALPYPAPADPADVPLDMQELADRIEALLSPASQPIVPAVHLYNSANYNVGLGVWHTVVFDTERYDTNNMHVTTPNPERITIQTPGLYSFTFNIGWASGGGIQRRAAIQFKGTTSIATGVLFMGGQNTDAAQAVSGVWPCVAGDWAIAQTFTDGAVVLPPNSYFAAERIGRLT
jgi:hypothetical protein